MDGFVTRVAKSINQPKVEGEAEKLSPQDKAPRTDNPDDSDDMDIEITEIIPPKDASNIRTNDKRLDHFNLRYLESLRT